MYLLRNELFSWEWTEPEYDEETGELVSLGGYTVTSKVEGCKGNSIFLPAAGAIYDYGLSSLGSYGTYWSSDSDSYYSDCAPVCCFDYFSYYWDFEYSRYYGRSIRGVCGERPPLPPYSLDAQYAYSYHSSGSGYSIAFLESVDSQEDNVVYTDGKWLKIDIPEEIMNSEVDMTNDLDGANWSFYFNSDAFSYYYTGSFESGSMIVTIDEDSDTIEFELDAVAKDGRVVHCSYSGPLVEVDDFVSICSAS